MARTTDTLVKGVLLLDYDSRRLHSLTPFIEAANLIVSRVATCATRKEMTLSSDELEMIERWLAAHMYVQSDQTFASKSTSGASGSHHGQTGMGLENSKYGQTAKMLDPSGCLAALDKQQVAGAHWLGKPPSEQTPYVDRD